MPKTANVTSVPSYAKTNRVFHSEAVIGVERCLPVYPTSQHAFVDVLEHSFARAASLRAAEHR